MAPSNIKQWTTTQKAIDDLTLRDAERPEPGEGEVLVEIHAVSLNYRDTEVVMGLYNHHKSVSQTEAPLVPCSDMVGTIIAVGPSSSSSSSSPSSPKWSVGDRVLSTFAPDHLTGQITPDMLGRTLGKPLDGVLATHRVFPATGLVRAPQGLSDEEACTLPIAGVTAWMALEGGVSAELAAGAVGKGKTVLVQGTGGVSMAGLLIAKASGAKVIVTSSSDAKLEKARSLGADTTINYNTTPDWHTAILEATSNHGADFILETGGAQTLRKSFDCIAFGGTIACIGYTSGKEEPSGDEEKLNVNVLALRRNVTLKGILNGPRDRFEGLVKFVEEKGVKMVVDRVFGFEEAVEAFKYLQEGRHLGKVVIRVKEN